MAARSKVLIIHEKYGRFAGAEQHLIATAPALNKTFDLDFLYWQRTGKDEELMDHLFNRTFPLDFSAESAPLQQAVAEIIQQSKPDLIYLNKCLSNPLLEIILASKIPTIRMFHDHEVYCMRGYKYFPWSREICHRKAGPCCLIPCHAFIQRDRNKGPYGLKWVSYTQKMRLIELDHQLDAFFVDSHYMRDELLLQGYDPKRISIFPPIAPNPANTKPPEMTPDNVILYLGQVVRGKGVDCLLRAATKLQSDFKLLIVGDGTHLPYCRSLATELALNHRVEFVGYKPHHQLQSYFRSATVAVVPSVWPEPFGMVGLEFMHHALPIVAFNSGGISDWLKDGHNGFLVPWMDIDTMAQRIDYLLQNKEEARQLGLNGQSLAYQQFNFDKYIVDLTHKFHELIKFGARNKEQGAV